LIVDLQGEELEEWIRYAREEIRIPVKNELIKGRRVHQSAYFSHGWILVTTHEPLSAETIQILERFASVFDLTYRRFLDLQKAEGQAREAQIETALERVRAKAMAMHSSEDLVLTISSFVSELQSLRVVSLRCGVSLVDKESRVGHFTATAATEQGQSKELSGNLTLAGHPILDAIYDNWKNQKEYHPILKGDEIREYYKVMNREVEFPDFPKELVQFGHYFSFKEGFVFAWTESALKEEELQIFRKFTSVLSLTHRRYKDLKEAEAQAREAKIEAALERVRSRTMAMHRSEEIADIVGKIFGELRQLDLVLNRVLIWIFNNEEKYITWWSANPEAEGNAESYRIDYNDQPVFLT